MPVAVITGSTKGIGRGLAEQFIGRGFDVMVSSRHAADAERVAAELTLTGPGRAAGAQCDVSQAEQVKALWDAAVAQLGGVDYWINNAGWATGQWQVHEMPEQAVHTLVDSNLKGAVFGSQVAVRGFRERGAGKLYNMMGGSYNSRFLTPNMGVYSATKSGIWRMHKYLVAENKGTGIICGSLSPGVLITDNWIEEQKQMPPDEWQKMKPIMNILCDHVDTSTPWLAERMIDNDKHGAHIQFMSNGKLMRRFIAAKVFGKKRDLFSRYGLD